MATPFPAMSFVLIYTPKTIGVSVYRASVKKKRRPLNALAVVVDGAGGVSGVR